MNYETESALRRKVDEGEFNILRQKVDHLENENRQLRERTAHLESHIANHRSAMDTIIQVMIESGLFEDDCSRLNGVRQYL